MIDETPLFFPSGRHSLFGVLHKPAAAQPGRPAFVFCHPFGEEKLWTHRAFVLYARELAADGHAVLRFDYMGNGDSEGEFSESSVSTARGDVQRAIAQVRAMTGAPAVSLLGLRFGATIASLVADDTPVQDLVLWAPITDGDRYSQELLRINVTTQMATFKEVRQERPELVAAMQQGGTANVDGYELSYAHYSEMAAVKLAAAPHTHSGGTLIVNVDRQPRPSPELDRLAATYPHATVTFAQEEPFWKEIQRSYQRRADNLFAATSDWLRSRR
jgi:exosortase A-associated hydrolase 2